MLQDDYIGICSQAAKGRYLQARKRGGPQRLCFFSNHWGIWEQWKVRNWSAASTDHALNPSSIGDPLLWDDRRIPHCPSVPHGYPGSPRSAVLFESG